MILSTALEYGSLDLNYVKSAPAVVPYVTSVEKTAQVVTGPPIGIPGVASEADYLARLEAMQHSEVTALMQAHVSASATTVDAAGVLAFTVRQRRAVRRFPKLFAAFRGNRIDVMARDAIMNDSQIQNMLPGLQDYYTGGPDFYQPSSFRWWDMTTQARWQAHLDKYSGNGTLLLTR